MKSAGGARTGKPSCLAPAPNPRVREACAGPERTRLLRASVANPCRAFAESPPWSPCMRWGGRCGGRGCSKVPCTRGFGLLRRSRPPWDGPRPLVCLAFLPPRRLDLPGGSAQQMPVPSSPSASACPRPTGARSGLALPGEAGDLGGAPAPQCWGTCPWEEACSPLSADLFRSVSCVCHV